MFAEDRFYHYYFSGISEPITVMAKNRIEARKLLSIMDLPEEYMDKKIDQESTSEPIPGVSMMQIEG